jgi:hypothetical protein
LTITKVQAFDYLANFLGITMTHEPYSLETGLVAVTLSAVVRLQQAFLCAGADHRRPFLLAAADLMDRTIPARELAPALRAASSDPVPVLVENRHQIAAVPPGLWNTPRMAPAGLGAPHKDGLAVVDRVLRRGPTCDDEERAALLTWLAPAWQAYPQLRAETLTLLQQPETAPSSALLPSLVRPGALL